MKTILFDLDGTLLPMDVEAFTQFYFQRLMVKMSSVGYDGKMILKAVGAGSIAMVKNDGKRSNEEVFWETFTALTKINRNEIEDTFYQFYTHEFNDIGKDTLRSQNMIDAVKLLKEKGYRMHLATNPLFPSIATEERIQWAGLDINDFESVTTYEYCSFSKPNIEYYKEILEKHHLDPQDCIMVGNDTEEDGVVEKLGIPLYLIEDYIINRTNEPLKSYWHGSSQEFLEIVKKEF